MSVRVARGFVVGAIDRGEADRRIALLTPEEGLVWATARGARRSKRRFAGVLEPGNEVEVELDPRGGLIEASALHIPTRARAGVERLALLLYGCEWIAAFAERGEPSPKMHGLFQAFSAVLDGVAEPTAATRVAFEAKVLSFAGVLATPERCAVCREPLAAPAVFAPEAGGACHQWCATGPEVPIEALWAVATLRRTPLIDTPGLPDPREPWLLTGFARYLLGRELRSASVLRALGRSM